MGFTKEGNQSHPPGRGNCHAPAKFLLFHFYHFLISNQIMSRKNFRRFRKDTKRNYFVHWRIFFVVAGNACFGGDIFTKKYQKFLSNPNDSIRHPFLIHSFKVCMYVCTYVCSMYLPRAKLILMENLSVLSRPENCFFMHKYFIRIDSKVCISNSRY